MERRIVQVGSQYIIATFADGRYSAHPSGTEDVLSHRNPRTLLSALPESDVYSNVSDVERSFRSRYPEEPVWDLYDNARQQGAAISLDEASRSLGVDAATLRNQIHNRSLAGYKIGRNWAISDTELERYRAENLGAVGRKAND